MKWSAIVIGVLLCLMPMAFAQQPEAEETDVLTENLSGIISGGVLGSGLGGILSGGLGGAGSGFGGIFAAVGSIIGGCLAGLNLPVLILAGIADVLQSISYWIGDIFLMFMALCGMIWDYSILNEFTALMGDIGTWCAGITTAEGLDYFEGILDTCISTISIIGILSSIAWAVGSSLILGTLSSFVGRFIVCAPLAWCCWPFAAVIALIDGLISAVVNIIFGVFLGGIANVISGLVLLSAEIFPPLKWCGARPNIWALGVGGIGGIVGAFFGAVLGAILGGFGLPICLGCFTGALFGAISGLIDGFGTGFIAAGWH